MARSVAMKTLSGFFSCLAAIWPRAEKVPGAHGDPAPAISDNLCSQGETSSSEVPTRSSESSRLDKTSGRNEITSGCANGRTLA